MLQEEVVKSSASALYRFPHSVFHMRTQQIETMELSTQISLLLLFISQFILTPSSLIFTCSRNTNRYNFNNPDSPPSSLYCVDCKLNFLDKTPPLGSFAFIYSTISINVNYDSENQETKNTSIKHGYYQQHGHEPRQLCTYVESQVAISKLTKPSARCPCHAHRYHLLSPHGQEICLGC